jgi:hypothetical protein
MKDIINLHVPFAQLPLEARVLFAIYASAAATRFGITPPELSTLLLEVEEVWNANRLTRLELSDPVRITALLKSDVSPSIGDKKKSTGSTRKRRQRTKGA